MKIKINKLFDIPLEWRTQCVSLLLPMNSLTAFESKKLGNGLTWERKKVYQHTIHPDFNSQSTKLPPSTNKGILLPPTKERRKIKRRELKVFWLFLSILQTIFFVFNRLYRFVKFFLEKSVYRGRFNWYIFEYRCPPLVLAGILHPPCWLLQANPLPATQRKGRPSA